MGIQGTNNRPVAFCRLAIAAALAGAATSTAAQATNQPGTVNAVVVRPNTLVKTDDLDFGSLIGGTAGGTVTINPVTNARTTTGGVTPAGSGAHRAAFQGTGGILFITVTGSNSVTLTRTGGGAAPMTATLTRAMTTSGGGITLLGPSVTLLPSGVQTYYVGGTLTVPANQPPGDYSGTFQLTVNYL